MAAVRFRVSMMACSIAMVLGCAIAQAQGDTSAKVAVNIEAQPILGALQAFGKQTGVQVLFRSEDVGVGHVKTPRVSGQLSAREALERLLKNTRLKYEFVNEHTVRVASATSVVAGAGDPPGDDTKKEVGKSASWEFRSGEVDQGPAGARLAGNESSKPENVKLEEVVVTGTHLSGVSDTAVTVRAYTNQQIQRSGQATIADFLNQLPDVSTSSNALTGQLPGTTTVQLHGLPAGTTLTLIDGRRVETSYNGYFDLGNVPLSAVDHIDVLPVGASAIYGADALGGAVNVVLRKHYDGLEANATVTTMNGATDKGASIAWGHTFGAGSISMLGTVQQTGELDGSARSETSATVFPAGAPTFIYVSDSCFPGNVYSLTGQNLPGLTGPEAAIPGGVSGKPTLQQFASTTGTVNSCNVWRDHLITPASTRTGLLVSADYQFDDSATVFSQLITSRMTVRGLEGWALTGFGGSFGQTVLGASNPYNPFGEDVGVSFAYQGMPSYFRTTSTFVRPLLGIRGDLGSRWNYEATAYWSYDRLDEEVAPSADPVLFAGALASADPKAALNPFSTSAPGSPELLGSLVPPAAKDRFDAKSLDVQAILRGAIAGLPAGAVDTAFGADYRKDSQNVEQFLQNQLELARNVYAVFAEARVPLIASRAVGDLSSIVAGRYDHNSDFGGKPTWQATLTWEPTRDLSLAAGHGTSYRAPQLQEIGGAPTFLPAYSIGVTDPLRNNEPVVASVTQGRNPGLQPETGKSTTFSVSYRAKESTGFKATLTDFTLDISRYIGEPTLNTVVDNPDLFPGSVVRGPPGTPGTPGPITAINDLFYNYGDLHVAGLDADLGYIRNISVGSIAAAVSISNIYSWRSALTPGQPQQSYLGQAVYAGAGWAPRWKATTAVTWTHHGLSFGVLGRYTGRYRDYQDFAPNTNELGNVWIWDLNTRYDFPLGHGSKNDARSFYIAGVVTNVFNRTPNFSYGAYPFDPSIYDIRNRMFTITVGMRL